MHILTILGSPRKHGNTAAVLCQFEALATDRSHTLERINITDVKINGCLGCDSCFKQLEEPGCVQKDDLTHVLERILAADLVVYASPVYCWGFTAQLKSLFDRHYCLVKWQHGKIVSALMTGKPTALLMTCGGDAPSNLDLPQVAFTREMEYLRANLRGMYGLADVESREDARVRGTAIAEKMAAELFSQP